MKIKLTENIKRYRKQCGLTQVELAEELSRQQSLISKYEKGYRMPDIYTLCRLASIFEITLDELVEWREE